jgi:phenylacetate-coenzyme A ligase PaaK-like adenylate-forming protein
MQKDENISNAEPGSIVITRLYGTGTPIIRYTGIDDIVTPLGENYCCEIAGSLIKKIHGRKSDSIILPDGKIVMLSFLDTIIGELFHKMKIENVYRIQIIQHKIDYLEIKLLMDESFDKNKLSTNRIFKLLKNKLLEKLTQDIKIVINNVEKLDKDAPYLISKINRSEFIENKYLF